MLRIHIIVTIIACPSILRSDYGTENCSLATIHIAFRYNHDDAMAREKSFMYGPSTSNIVCQNKAILGLGWRLLAGVHFACDYGLYDKWYRVVKVKCSLYYSIIVHIYWSGTKLHFQLMFKNVLVPAKVCHLG